jgi:lipid-A-disaccharide synthase
MKGLYPQIETACVFADHLDPKWRNAYASQFDLSVAQEQMLEIFSKTKFAVAASGTVTLNLGLYQIPTIVCYRVSLLNAFIYRAIVPYKGPVSLTNIIMDKMIFPELLQEDCAFDAIFFKMQSWMNNSELLRFMRLDLVQIKERLKGEQKNPCSIIKELFVR